MHRRGRWDGQATRGSSMRFDGRDELDGEFEGKLTRALVAAPVPVIASDFATRVALRARGEESGRRLAGPVRSSGYGRLVIYVTLPVLLVAMLLLARFAAPMNPVTLGIVGLTTLEVVFLGLYLAMRPGEQGD